MFTAVGLLADDPVVMTIKPVPAPKLDEASLRSYWHAEAKAQKAQVDLMLANATRDAQVLTLRRQCQAVDGYDLVVDRQDELYCAKSTKESKER